ncbi:hypothetical protein GGI1_14079 [Acidithiobacillus sp. GGI-221]|nr:hypothetical protein GGI1_14079 [Acidithiobacillus sp. GGI-221]
MTNGNLFDTPHRGPEIKGEGVQHENVNRLQSQATHAKAARASMLIIWSYYRQVIDKNQHVKNAIDLVRRLSDLMHAREHAHTHQLKDIDNSIEQLRNRLNTKRAITNQRLIGLRKGCTTDPTSSEPGNWDWTSCENVADEYIYCDALTELFSAQLASLSRTIRFLSRVISDGWRGDMASQATIKGLAEDISSGKMNVWNAEIYSAIVDASKFFGSYIPNSSNALRDMCFNSSPSMTHYFYGHRNIVLATPTCPKNGHWRY